MSLLEEVFASGGTDVIIRTLELTSPGWPAPILICNGFTDQVLTTEDGRTLTFTAANIGIELPKVNNKGNQALAFTVDNTTGEPQHRADEALAARARVTAVYRTYLSSNKTVPAERPYTLTVQSDEIEGNTAQLQCGYFDMIGVAWPRVLYTLRDFPALRWI
jgi:hypothetical protein